MSRWDPEPDEVHDVRPYDFAGAKRAIARQSRDATDAEATIRDAAKKAAEADHVYRVALAKKILELKAEGMAATIATDVARGSEPVATLRYERDVAEGLLDAVRSRPYQVGANRRQLEQLITWSMRIEFGSVVEPGSPEPVPVPSPSWTGGRQVA